MKPTAGRCESDNWTTRDQCRRQTLRRCPYCLRRTCQRHAIDHAGVLGTLICRGYYSHRAGIDLARVRRGHIDQRTATGSYPWSR